MDTYSDYLDVVLFPTVLFFIFDVTTIVIRKYRQKKNPYFFEIMHLLINGIVAYNLMALNHGDGDDVPFVKFTVTTPTVTDRTYSIDVGDFGESSTECLHASAGWDLMFLSDFSFIFYFVSHGIFNIVRICRGLETCPMGNLAEKIHLSVWTLLQLLFLILYPIGGSMIRSDVNEWCCDRSSFAVQSGDDEKGFCTMTACSCDWSGDGYDMGHGSPYWVLFSLWILIVSLFHLQLYDIIPSWLVMNSSRPKDEAAVIPTSKNNETAKQEDAHAL